MKCIKEKDMAGIKEEDQWDAGRERNECRNGTDEGKRSLVYLALRELYVFISE